MWYLTRIFFLHSVRSQDKILKKILLLKDPFYRNRQFHTIQCDTGIKKGLLESWGTSLESQFDITTTLLAFYRECRSLIGYAIRYLFCCSRSISLRFPNIALRIFTAHNFTGAQRARIENWRLFLYG